MYRIVAFFLALSLLGCASSGSIQQVNNTQNTSKDLFKLEVQQAPPNHIQSIQLYSTGSKNNPPIIALNSSQKLVLEFDHLTQSASQFKIKITHRNKDWGQSSLSPNFYLDSFNEFYFGGGLKSFSQRPSFFHYSYEFPNDQISFEVSGNYLIEVFDYQSNKLLFSLPFFITENRGQLSTRVNRLYAQRSNFRLEHQLFSRYLYPAFIENPQFNLSFSYVQNQFWGRTKTVSIFDTATPGEVNFHLGRRESFIGDFEFNALNLANIEADGKQIVEVQQDVIPPKVILRRDIENLDPPPRFLPDPRLGLAIDDRSASYARVQFKLEADQSISGSESIYLVGDFNEWMISEKNRMKRNESSGLWEGEALIKQGFYAYKYAIVKNGAINALSLDRGFSENSQNYLTFIYYKDPSRNYDRLLKVVQTKSK
ncbi:MAG: DUF5103 domain-containing protein [Balneolaceae bacterium]|nr:DUF5103 domain-containing protein [Balneolaceae bacterium]